MVYTKETEDLHTKPINSEAATRCVLSKKVFLEISQNLQENICARGATLLKKRLWHRCFSCKFCEISKNTFFTEHHWTTASVIFSLMIPAKR